MGVITVRIEGSLVPKLTTPGDPVIEKQFTAGDSHASHIAAFTDAAKFVNEIATQYNDDGHTAAGDAETQPA